MSKIALMSKKIEAKSNNVMFYIVDSQMARTVRQTFVQTIVFIKYLRFLIKCKFFVPYLKRLV